MPAQGGTGSLNLLESKAAKARCRLSSSPVNNLAHPSHQGAGGQAVGTQRTDQVGVPKERAVAQIDALVPEKVEFFRRPDLRRHAGDIGGDAMGSGKLITQRSEAVIAGTEIVALPGDELASDFEIELPAQSIVGEDLTAGDAAGSDPLEEKQARAFLQLDDGALVITSPGLRDKGLGDPLEEGIALDPQVLLAQGRRLAAGPVNPGGTRRAEDHPAAGAGGDIEIETIAIEKARGGIDEVDQQRAGLDVGLAEMDRRAERLAGEIGRTVGPDIAAEVEVTVDGPAGDAGRMRKSLHDRAVYWTADFSPLEMPLDRSSGLKSAVQ